MLRAEMDESRCQGEGQRVEFELMMADARNMRGACVLLGEYGGDVSKLKEPSRGCSGELLHGR